MVKIRKNNLKALLCFLIFLSCIVHSSAATVQIDVINIRYTVDDEAMTAEVYGPVSTSTTIKNLVIPDFIEYNNTPIPVISIRDYAFSKNGNISGSVTIGDNVEIIGDYSFEYCKCLGSLIIGNSVKIIGNYAFQYSNFKGNLILGNSITSIGKGSFMKCPYFTGDLIIPNSVKTIGENAFLNSCVNCSSLILGDSIETIEKSAFLACNGFSGPLIIPNSIKKIGDSAFSQCIRFTSLELGESLLVIEDYAFSYNNFIGELNLNENIQFVGEGAFKDCSGFTGSLTIPDNVQTIGSYAFSNCTGFNGTLSLGNNVETIGQYAFENCSGFNGVLNVNGSVNYIGGSAFINCKGFTSLILGESIKSIGDANYSHYSGDAFNGCNNLSDITCLATEPPLNFKANFDKISYERPLYVPSQSLNLYKTAADWKDFKYINPISVEATAISLNKDELNLIIGQEETLIATLTPEDATTEIVWSVDNNNIISIEQNGKVTALAVGKATVTATAGDVSATCNITVNPVMASGVTLNVQDMTLLVGQTDKLTATVTPENTTDKTITWKSDNEAVATVGTDGTVTAISVGVANITATCGEATATCKVTVNPVVASGVTLNVQDMTLLVGQTDKLTATVTPENTTDKTITWKSDNESVATVGADGTVTAVSVGIANITATCGEATGTCKVTVNPVVASGVTINVADMTLLVGQTDKLTATVTPENTTDKTITWKSDNESVATVGADGTVTAVSVGVANITATCGEATGTCKVTVNPVVASGVTINVADMTLLVGQTDMLTATVTPENTTDKTITWKSDNESVATVGADGSVTAVSVGVANITASCGNATATCKVTVYGPEDVTVKPGEGTSEGDEDDTPGNNTENGGSLVGNDLTLRVNQSAAIDLVVPEGLSVEPKFAWSLDNGGAEFVRMTVKDNTLSATFQGLKVGQTGYTVSIVGANGNIEAVKGKITVIAEVPMTSLELDPASITMAQNALPETIKPVYTPNNASMPEFNWTSNVPTVATVDQNGKVTPVGQGQTIITCTALDGSGLNAISNVTVTAPIDEDFGFDESVMGGVEGVTIYIGDSYTLVPKAHDGYQLPENIVWSSSDDKIVSVDQNGKVTGLALGSATISATASINGKEITATCTVTVIPIKVSTIELSQTTAELRATETLTLAATIAPDNATDKRLQWTTNAPSIVSVSQEGVVTAHMVGEANITARALDGSNVTASCLVKVVPTIATGITVKAEGSTSIKATETVQLTATVTPETTTNKSVTWRSDKPSIATVNNSGVVTGVTVGEAIITATNSAGQTADINIKVIPTPVENIELNRYTAQIRVQDGFKLNANILPLTATNKTVSWTSSAPEIVSVDAEGNVLALALGNATITCEAQDGSGVKAECQITVTTTATQSVSITAEGSTTLKATETVQLKATVLPATASDKSVRWQSANPDIATVDNTGLVTAVSVGSVQITVTNSGGQTASVTITVIPTPVESIKLNKTSATLKATETLALIATVNPETATDKSLEWSSDNESVATVNQNGVVTAIAPGEAIITVKAKDGSNVSAACKVNVIATEVTSITITANGSTTLKASENVQLIANILPETATDKTVKWSASAPQIANVNENGLVTAYAVGESVITATSSTGLTANITITVIPTPVSGITLNRTTLTMRVGNENRLTATIIPETATDKTVTWASSNPEVAIVDAEGNVKALLEGQTSIICTANDGSGISASCIVNVVDTDVETVTITTEGPTKLKVSETVQLTATVMPETSTDKTIIWSSGDEKVAIVDANGLVTAISEGEVVITATTSNGLSDSVTITVVETQVTSITLNESSIILQANETYSLIPTIFPLTATNKEIIWSSGNTDIATVNQDGTVTAVAVGETSVSATAVDGSGVTATCKVTVILTPATSISITVNGETTLEINQTVQLTAEVLPENATDKTVMWTSSNESVAKVTETGLVTALSAGESVITATNSAGQYDRVTITVISNEPDEPEATEPVVSPADTPTQLLRKGDGTSHTFVAMMDKDDEILEAENYRYVFGYNNIADGTLVLEDTPWRYTHTNEDIYWNASNDFWVFAYYVDDEGTLHASSRRHLDSSVDNDFNAAELIGSATRSGEHIVGIYTVDGQFVGKDIKKLKSGIYIIRTSTSSYKIIR